ncbi:MAG: oxidoreductase [Deltaproteobacteria bacterium]|nr:oxidoreductase [Deltaproteobacteria bacterium]
MKELIVAVLVLVAGGVLAALLSRWPRLASTVGATTAVAGSTIGAVFAARMLGGQAPARVEIAWNVPAGAIVLGCDAVSAFFLLPVFVLGAIAAVYGRDYLLHEAHGKSLGVPWAAYCVLLASMALVATARHAIAFLVAWELMSLSSWVLVTFEHERAEVRRAGWVYLIAAHVGVAALTAAFLLWGATTGTLLLESTGFALPANARTALLLLALAGFGLKAGLFPLHVWLPEAHAAAPSHVSAVMSGVMVKLGVYGIVRMTMLVGGPPAWFARALLLLGLVTAIYGVVFATHQRDLKRALAYSSVENVGLVVVGVGLAMLGHATGRPTLAVLGAAGALLHVWNHAAMKGLAFLGAGAVVHATGTRDLERLGGLLRRMPVSGALFGLGAVAVAGLPPLNGFVGEWLLYRSLIDGAIGGGAGAPLGFTFAIGALSAVGVLAALAFVRLCSIALLGAPRSPEAAKAHEPTPLMVGSMAVLGLACIAGSVAPGALVRAFGAATVSLAGVAPAMNGDVRAALVPIGVADVILWITCVAGVLVAARVARRARGRGAEQETWGCGYAAPTARMQYTARGFAELATGFLPRRVQPHVEIARPRGLFPARAGFVSRDEDPVTRDVYERVLEGLADRFARLRWLQQGVVHLYVLYVFLAVVAALTWVSMRGWGGP